MILITLIILKTVKIRVFSDRCELYVMSLIPLYVIDFYVVKIKCGSYHIYNFVVCSAKLSAFSYVYAFSYFV